MTIKIAAAIKIFGNASIILLSILVAGRAITSIFKAFKAAIIVGMITTKNANEPAILGKLFCSLRPALVASFCTSKVETKLVTMPRTTLAMI